IARAEAQVRLPVIFSLKGFLILSTFSLFCWMLSRMFHTDKNARTLRQGRASLIVLGVWCASEGIIIVCLSWYRMADFQPLLSAAGLLLAVGMALFLVVKPAFVLPKAVQVCEPFLADVDYTERLIEARRRR